MFGSTNMKKQKEVTSINSNAFAYAKNLIDPRNKVTDAYVEGKWLRVELHSGVRLSVKNQTLD